MGQPRTPETPGDGCGSEPGKKLYLISEERILQISNDISEDMCEATDSELIEVVKYWRDCFDALLQAGLSARTETAVGLLKLGTMLLKPWGAGS